MTEELYCPLSGDRAAPGPRRRERNPNPLVLIPGLILPGELTDGQAEHERAVLGAHEWSRHDGKVYLWVEM